MSEIRRTPRDNQPAPSQGRGAPKVRRIGARNKGDVNWARFWMQMLVAMVVFNVVAGLITWYFIFPRLFPGRH